LSVFITPSGENIWRSDSKSKEVIRGQICIGDRKGCVIKNVLWNKRGNNSTKWTNSSTLTKIQGAVLAVRVMSDEFSPYYIGLQW